MKILANDPPFHRLVVIGAVALAIAAGCGVRYTAPKWALDISNYWGLILAGTPSNPEITSVSSLKGSLEVSMPTEWWQDASPIANECSGYVCLKVGWWALDSDFNKAAPLLVRQSSNFYYDTLTHGARVAVEHMDAIHPTGGPIQIRMLLVPEVYSLDTRFVSNDPNPVLLFVFPVKPDFSDSALRRRAFQGEVIRAFATAAHELFHLTFATIHGFDQAVSKDLIEQNETGAVCSEKILESKLSVEFDATLDFRAQSEASYQHMLETMGMSSLGDASVLVRSRIERKLIEAVRSVSAESIAGTYSAVVGPNDHQAHSSIREKCENLIE